MLTKKFFGDWLRSKALDENAGRTRAAFECPISTCLKENGATNVSVSGYATYCKNGERFEIHGEWIADFVVAIDRLLVLPKKERGGAMLPSPREVDVGTCLKTLELKNN